MHAVTASADASGAIRRVAAKALAAWICLPLCFVATGGSLGWWQAWAYCAVLLVPMAVFLAYMARRDPEFLARRLQVRERERSQRLVQAWGSLAILGALVLPGIDHRFGWSRVPPAVVVAALGVSLLSYLAVLRVFLENRWAGRTVETWQEQRVISTGPYAIVRHPMYTGMILSDLFLPLALGSWWAAVPAGLMIALVIWRTAREDQTLRAELPGYADYAQRTRFRLLPGLW